MQTVLVLVGCVVLVVLAFAWVHLRVRREEQARIVLLRQHHQALERELEAVAAEYGLVRTSADVAGRVGLGLREEGLLLAHRVPEGLELRPVDPDDLIGAEVVEHVYGRSAGKAPGVAQVRAVELRVFVADATAPTWLVGFLLEEAPFGSPEHQAARDEAHRWEGLVRALVHDAGRQAAAERRLAGMSDADRQREKARALADRYLRDRQRLEPAGAVAVPAGAVAASAR